MNSLSVDLICVDWTALDDLLFWNQFAQAQGEGRRGILLLGTGERAERTAGPRTSGTLDIPADRADAFEQAAREEIKNAVSLLTDMGVATVGFLGSDRNFLKNVERRVEIGDWTIPLQSARQNVLPLIMTVARDESGNWVDSTPFSVAVKACEKLDLDVRIVVMAQRLTGAFKQASEHAEPVSLPTLVEEGCIAARVYDSTPSGWYLQHVSKWGKRPPVPVVPGPVVSP